MKPWVEWLLSIAFLMLVVTVIVALVIGFVRWFRPKPLFNPAETLKPGHAAASDDEDEQASLEFDLGSPQESTIWRRRQMRTQNIRRYTGANMSGELFQILIRPPSRTIEYIRTPNGNNPLIAATSAKESAAAAVSGTATYARRRPKSGVALSAIEQECWVLNDIEGVMSVAYEVPGKGVLLGLTDGTVVIGLPETASNKPLPVGRFNYMHFYHRDPAVTEIGFLKSIGPEDAAEPKKNLVNADHRLQYQPFRPFQTDNPVYGETGMALSELAGASASAGSGVDTVVVGSGVAEGVGSFLRVRNPFGGEMRVFGAADAVAVVFDRRSTLIMTPQTCSADLPFPIRARYVAIAQRLSTQKSADGASKEGKEGEATMVTAIVDVMSADGSVHIYQDSEDLFSGKLTPINNDPHNEDPLDKPLIDPCHGTFTSSSDGADKLVVQFSGNHWCTLCLKSATSFIRGYALLVHK